MTPDERDGATEVTDPDVPDPDASGPDATAERPAVRPAEPEQAAPKRRAAKRRASARDRRGEPADVEDRAGDTDAEDAADAGTGDEDTGDEDTDDEGGEKPRRRDHPTFESLVGFYTGLVLVLVVPGGGSALLGSILGYDRAGPLFPYLALVLLIPLGLLVPERTRRFARYMLLGALLTAVVVLGVGALTLWVLLAVKS